MEDNEDFCFATQPSDSDYSSVNETGKSVAWAKLSSCSVTTNRKHYWLENDEFVAGRQSSCNLKFRPEEHTSVIYPLFSKIHFIIEKCVIRDVSVAFIKDVSSNGTFVNDELVGNNQRRVLSHEDVISVAKIDYRVYTFLYQRPCAEPVPKQVKLEYHIVDRIGKGGFGDVYYVLNKKTCAPFAMKMISVNTNINESLDAFTELKVLQSIKHKNIVEFHGNFMKDSRLFLILEFMAGGDLAQLLVRKKRLLEPVAKHIFYQVTDGVNFLHLHDIVHRDIKPLNILLYNDDEYPVVKITDFGLSKKLKKKVSSVKEIVGTGAYRAPELRGSHRQICDKRVDVWSLGVLLYFCLGGKYPFESGNGNKTKTLKFDPISLWYHISLPPKDIIKKSLRFNFQERPFCNEILLDRWFQADINNQIESPVKKLKTI